MSDDLRLLVCGGRDFRDHALIDAVLSALQPVVVIEGGAKGADAYAGDWAEARGVERETYPADWWSDGKAAGPIRNARMLREGKPTLVVAFPGGRGTEDMCRKAKAAGVPVLRVGATDER